MAENILLGALRRYEFYSYCTNFIQTLYDTVTQDLYGDIHWEWTLSTNNSYATPRAWNRSTMTSSNMGTITAKNIKDPSMFLRYVVIFPWSIHIVTVCIIKTIFYVQDFVIMALQSFQTYTVN